MTTADLNLRRYAAVTEEQLLQEGIATPWEARLGRLRWWSLPAVATAASVAFWPMLGKLSLLPGLFLAAQAFRVLSHFAHRRIRPLWLTLHHRFGLGSLLAYMDEDAHFGRDAGAAGYALFVIGAAQPGGQRVWVRLRIPQANATDGTIEVRRVRLARSKSGATLERGRGTVDGTLASRLVGLDPARFEQLPPGVIDGFPCCMAHVDWQTAERHVGSCNLADRSTDGHPMVQWMELLLNAAEAVPVEVIPVREWRHFE